jgi:hypothetical protein
MSEFATAIIMAAMLLFREYNSVGHMTMNERVGYNDTRNLSIISF